MREYTHIIRETGSGLPGVGDEVLAVDYNGRPVDIMVAEAASAIQTRHHEHWIKVTLKPGRRDYHSLPAAEQAKEWEIMHHASPVPKR